VTASSFDGTGDRLTIGFAETFTSDFVERHRLRLKAKDDTGTQTVLTKHGFIVITE
jgi:hypothetical protein